jgi:pimeloyl-ACP methyl ester carboxylesterase
MKRVVSSLALVALLVAVPAADAKKRTKRPIKSLPVTFTVHNTNTSKFPCASDGATYQVRGHITGPASALASASRKKKRKRPRAATIYLHGLGVAEWLWYFPTSYASYNYAMQEAKLGHVSVTVDRLGYRSSDHPPGNQVCIGSEADVAHQLIQALKTGSYAVTGGKPVKYKRVALAGHSAAGEIAILEAYSYRDVNAVIVVAFSFSNLPAANIAFGNQRNACNAGTGPSPGYAYFGQPGAEFEKTFFHSAEPAVRSIAVSLHPPDPCGLNLSLTDALNKQAAGVRTIKVPALEVCGANDALYATFGCDAQIERFASRDKKEIIIKNAGHGLPLEKPARTFQRKISSWLSRRGF